MNLFTPTFIFKYFIFFIFLFSSFAVYCQAPVITSFSPVTGYLGKTETINGKNFTGATSVSFGGIPATYFAVIDDSTIKAIADTGATGAVNVITPSGQFFLGGFTFAYPPVIYTVTPDTTRPGTFVTVTGKYFSEIIYGFTIGGNYINPTIVSDSVMTFTVNIPDQPFSAPFYIPYVQGVQPIPLGFITNIPKSGETSISPQYGTTGTKVTVRGSYFTTVSSVTLGGVEQDSVTLIDDNTITFVANGNTPSGNQSVIVTTLSGTNLSTVSFNFDPEPPPVISSFSPTVGSPGDTITIKGSYFSRLIGLTIGGYNAAITGFSDSVIKAVLGFSGGTGDVSATTWSGTSVPFPGFIFDAKLPAVDSISPVSGGVGTVVSIAGKNFTRTNTVNVGSVTGFPFKVISDSLITITIGANGPSGLISIYTAYGSTIAGSFAFTPLPVIISFSPDSATNNGSVTIKGSYFTGTTAVSFGGIPAASFTLISDSVINAVVAFGASGNINVTTGFGIDSIAGFKYYQLPPAPVVTAFTPVNGTTGTVVTITGHHFTSALSVSFSTTPATSFTVISDSVLTAVVGSGASGYVRVVTLYGSDSNSYFNYMPPYQGPPSSITSFSPAQAKTGDTVTISGHNLLGATAVSFGGISATAFSFSYINNDTVISAIVGAGASGIVAVQTPSLLDTLYGFTYIPDPSKISVTSISPNSVVTGSKVIITGTHFTGATQVLFGGLAATSFNVVSDTVITAVVEPGISGYVNLTIASAADTITITNFLYVRTANPNAPVITSFTPAVCSPGTVITIYGYNFTNVTYVLFDSIPPSSFTIVSDSVITAVISPSDASGYITVHNVYNGQSLRTSVPGFIFVDSTTNTHIPVVNSFSPTSGSSGSLITIKGSNFTGTSFVMFGNDTAISFNVLSDSLITATVGEGASGNVTVTTNTGIATLSGFVFTTHVQKPVIVSFSPSIGTTGTIVSIKGFDFTGTTAVNFGNVNAPSFTVISDSLISAVVGSGASGNINIVSPGGTGIDSGFTFIEPQIDSPFILNQFSGTVVGTQVLLQWKTANEKSIISYGIQSGSDSISFEIMGSLAALQNDSINNSYQFTDSVPKYPVIYYRLAITDTAGNITYSTVIKVSLSVTAPQSIKLYPNPAQSYITISHPASTANAGINIEDMSGRILKTIYPTVGSLQTTVEIAGIPNGVVTIRYTDGNIKNSQQLLIDNN